MEIVLVKQTDERLSDDEAAVVRKFLMGHLAGATDKDTRAWNRFVRALNEAGSGEYFSIKTQRARDGRYHRKHMAVISAVFKAQERITDFEQFRLWLKVGSGFVTWCAGPKGGVFPVPRSISFATCEEDEMREFHEGVVDFLRMSHALEYLWPGVSVSTSGMGMDSILNKFERPAE